MNLSAVLLAVLLLALPGCENDPARVQTARLVVFGTLVDISAWDIGSERFDQAVSEVELRLRQIHEDLHAWHPGRLKEINQALASGESSPLNPEIEGLIAKSTRLFRQSGGLFNPAIGRLIAEWGFQSDNLPSGPPPSGAAVKVILDAHPEMTDLHLSGGRIESLNPEVQLDLGGFAKGYAVDEAIEILRSHGIINVICNAGGDLRVLGRHGKRAWHIGIRDPRGAGVIASIDAEGDQSVFTSGDYERYYIYDGKRYHHIIDPRSGYPATGARSVTVIATRSIVADAAATALFVAGPGNWPDIARSMGIDLVMMIDQDGAVEMSQNMVDRVHFGNEFKPAVTVY